MDTPTSDRPTAGKILIDYITASQAMRTYWKTVFSDAAYLVVILLAFPYLSVPEPNLPERLKLINDPVACKVIATAWLLVCVFSLVSVFHRQAKNPRVVSNVAVRIGQSLRQLSQSTITVIAVVGVVPFIPHLRDARMLHLLVAAVSFICMLRQFGHLRSLWNHTVSPHDASSSGTPV